MSRYFSARFHSIRNALRGWSYILRTQPNTWLYLALTIAVILMGLLLNLNRHDWLWLCLAITLVWSAELINTAVESLVDLTTPQQHPLARIAKDAAAGAVLVLAIFAAIVGLVILLPPVISLFTQRSF